MTIKYKKQIDKDTKHTVKLELDITITEKK